MNRTDFSLIHIVCNELETPLLHTQVYERALYQTLIPLGSAPKKTYVLFFEAFSTILSRKFYLSTKELRKSYFPVKFFLVPYSGRLGPWLTIKFLECYRYFFVKGRIIFHCRNYEAMNKILALTRKDDRIILDVRGYEPIETFARSNNKFDPREFTKTELALFEKLENEFGKILTWADHIFTVSKPLADYLTKRFKLKSKIIVVPCVGPSLSKTAELTNDNNQNFINIVYVGGAQSYQGLRELVMPFAKALLTSCPLVVVHFISQDKPAIEKYLTEFDIDLSRVVCKSIPQQNVQEYLQKMHLGLLLRPPSLMNSFSQPVKLGEYLASGVGVVFEEGTGNLKELLSEMNIGFSVKLWLRNEEEIKREAVKIITLFKQNGLSLRERCLKFSRDEYSWHKYSILENSVYHQMLKS